MEPLNVIADYNDLCGENPIWDGVTNTFYWTDCVGLRFHRYHPATGKHETMKEGLEINGAAFNQAGGFVISNNSGIWLSCPSTNGLCLPLDSVIVSEGRN